jgi:hypothetical protein
MNASEPFHPQSSGRHRRRSPGSLSWLWYRVVCTRWNVLLLALAAFFWVENDFENRLYDAFVAEALRPGMSEQEKVVALMQHTHDFLRRRGRAVPEADSAQFRGAKRVWLHSGDLHLLEGNADCGSYASVFVEACQRAGLPARLCQLRTGGQSIHVLAEAYANGHWAAVDPLFGQLFYDRDGRPAGLREVVADWPYYKGQSPPSYRNLGHDPEGVRYTNWSRPALLGPAAKRVLDWTVGREYAETVSVRTYLVNAYRVYLAVALWALATYNLTRLALAWRRGERQRSASRKHRRSHSRPAPLSSASA